MDGNYNRALMEASAASYREKLNDLLRNQGLHFSLGVFTLFVLVGAIFITTNDSRFRVREITEENRKAVLNPTPSKRVYTVQEGEGLWQIAEKTTGSGFNWVQIAEVNGIRDPDIIAPGAVLQIPPIGSAREEAQPMPTYGPPSPTPVEAGQIDGGMTGRANPSVREYTLQEGEGLWQAAEKVYGDGNVWTEIARENGITDPDAVYPGMKLRMPSIQ